MAEVDAIASNVSRLTIREDGASTWLTVKPKSFAEFGAEVEKEENHVIEPGRNREKEVAVDLEYDVKMFCGISLVSWTLKDDAGKAVPIDKAPDVFLGTGQKDPEIIKAGNELYFTLIEMARDKELFDIDDAATDEEEAKN